MSDQRVDRLAEKVDQLSSQVADLAGAVQALSLAVATQVQGQSVISGPPCTSYQVVSSAASVASEPVQTSERSFSSNGEYNSLAAEIPSVPDFCVSLCGSLRGGSLSFRERAARAWGSGWWARFTLAGRISKPRPSKACDVRNTIYVVLKAEGYTCPLYVSSGAQYRTIVGDFTGPTISHGFGSLAEAKVYALGAGVTLPSAPLQWSSPA